MGTLQAFATLPPISVLSGDRDEDLSEAELRECWADGSLGTTRVEREGFGRVWKEVSDYFEGDIMEEARKTAAKALKKKRTSTENEVVKVGETMSAAEILKASEQAQSQLKGMSTEDMEEAMNKMKDSGK